jgi:hypothetical protein
MSERWNAGVTQGELQKTGLADFAAGFTLREEFSAFDSLPYPIRRFLDEESRFKATSTDVQEFLRKHPTADPMRLLAEMKKNEQLCAEKLDITRQK